MDDIQMDWMMIVIAAALNMLMGYFWYSQWLFGPAWTKHLTKQPKYTAKTYVLAGVFSLVIAYFIALFQAYLGVTTVTDGMVIGFFLWLGFVCTTQVGAVLWANKPLKLFFINTGFKLFSFLVMGGVLGA